MKAVLTDDRFSTPTGSSSASSTASAASRSAEQRVRLLSRNDLSLNARFPEVVEALEARSGDRTRARRRGRRVRGRADDFAGSSSAASAASGLPLRLRPAPSRRPGRQPRCRCARARRCCARRSPSTARCGSPRTATATARPLAEACRRGWEGLIAKRADAPYTHGRSRDWLKFKCSAEQEFVIGGFTAPRGQPHRLRRAAARPLRRTAGCATPARSAPASRRHAARPAAQLAPLRRETLAVRRRGPRARRDLGRARLVAQVGFTSGRATAGCAIRGSWACATTRPPRRSCAEIRREPAQ